jgi:isopenicillin-N N-acyltransferase-like protein
MRGRDFGRRHAQQIRRVIERYQALFERVATRPFDVKALGARALERTAEFAGPLHAEMLGIATGAELAPELIGALNARTEILAVLGAPLRGECSTIVRIDPFSSAALSVQTWDWFSEFSEDWLVWSIPHSDGARTTTVTEFGIVGKIGVNSRGLGVHFNILHHRADGHDIGVPVHVLSRHVLDSTGDLPRALQIIASAAVSASSALTLVAAMEGCSVAVSAEVYPGGPGFVFPDATGLLVHTNHFLSAPARDKDTEPRAFPDTLVRHDLLTRRFSERVDLTPSNAVALMNSHVGTIGAVCCHPDPAKTATGQYATLATIILDVAAGQLQALPGGPCRHAQRSPHN